MHLHAQVIVNGSHILANSETTSWQDLRDGRVRLRLPPGIWRSLAQFDSDVQRVEVEVRIDGLATIESVDVRLRALERAIESSHILSRLSKIGR